MGCRLAAIKQLIDKLAPNTAPPAAHMRTRLPTVWSSRWMMKLPALATLVSGWKATL